MQTISGQPLSRFAFGAMQFGSKADASESGAMYQACRAAGINSFDTAFSYNEGRSEQILGKLMQPEREDVFYATKCAASGSTAAQIMSEFAQSQTRLGLDVIDLYYLHRWDPVTPLEETFGTMGELVAKGAVRHIGVSNFSAWQTMKAQAVAEKLGLTISALQPMYNLVKRQAEVEILPMAVSEGFDVFSYSPLGGGLLTGKYSKGEEGRIASDKMYNARYSPDWMKVAAQELLAIANQHGTSPATLAVAWAAQHQGITSPIISARSVAQLEPSLAAMSFKMDDALLEKITALSPTPAPATDRLEEA